MEYVWLSVLWILYFTLHSILASPTIKKRVISMNVTPANYRLTYNIIALITLVPIIIYSSIIASEYILSPNSLTKYSGLLLTGWGVVIARSAFKSYDTKAFLGLHSLEKENEFTTTGLLKYVRHPLYSGSILGVIGYFLYSPKLSTLISVGLIITYFLIGIQLEEKKLIQQFGQAYLDYKRNTPMLVPRISKKR